MTHHLNAEGYARTKAKLDGLRSRLAAILAKPDLAPPHRAEVARSYEEMMLEYTKELRLYEAAHPEEFAHIEGQA